MYEVSRVRWSPEFQDDIQEIYRMFKDQERKIFDLTSYYNNSDVMDFVQYICENEFVFLVKENETPIACFFLDDALAYKTLITRLNIHTVIRRPYWGAKSREICRMFIRYLDDKYPIHKLIAEVPQCGYGVIKLLKDLGFKHEGTLKDGCLFKDKNNKPKFYDTLIYSRIRKDIK